VVVPALIPATSEAEAAGLRIPGQIWQSYGDTPPHLKNKKYKQKRVGSLVQVVKLEALSSIPSTEKKEANK
jgi:hypothetical protein